MPDSFKIIKNQQISGSTVWNFINFIVCSSRGLPRYIKTQMLITYFHVSKRFLENKTMSGTSLPVSFSAWFLKKNSSLIIFYQPTKHYCVNYRYFLGYWAICVLQLFAVQPVTSWVLKLALASLLSCLNTRTTSQDKHYGQNLYIYKLFDKIDFF